MKNIQKAQSDLVNDTCNDCGSFVDVGAIIDEHDTVLELELSGDNCEQLANEVIEKAQQRFEGVTFEKQLQGQDAKVSITFSFSAEKMIFQLENGL
ncbi:conserved hypothetical protein [Shewanella halifaxensis HAW-EB4]|uniref:DUF406 family protein n=1 Tax=Shewanella halifaxensis (strain HAW-EB4) TaxID=458817 RepID=B0TSC4_SHEHH|nr:DUF406 family protein [Shewanella halifaxensis]ABZ76504.1 conserved hypothetical protein [Shewanella halifaxensis HAW-EB4]